MRALRRKRIYSILGFLGVVAFIFFCFQLFSLGVLNVENAREARISRFDHNHPHQELPPATEKVLRRRGAHLVKTTPKLPLPIEHAEYNECLPGSDCAKKAETQLEHAGEMRRHKYAVDKLLTHNPSDTMNARPGNLVESNKRLLDRIEKFGQYVDEKIKQNEQYDKDFKYKLEKLRQKNATLGQVGNQEGGELPGNHVGGLLQGVLGVLEQDQHLYQADSNHMFTCLHSKEKIGWDLVNDDFCDCSDGSDEPGTSACPDNKFYCTFQLEERNALWVWSSQVDDGICDCCDGSDEVKKVTLPPNLHKEVDKAYAGVYQEPCRDRCSHLIAAKLERERAREQGMYMRQQFLAKVRDYSNLDKRLYGEDGAWYYLYLECFESRADKYTYTLCPFRSVTQHNSPSQATNIGRDPHWLSFSYEGGYRLSMSEGDSQQCPERRSRTTMVEFSCGIENKILGVHETESCSYSIQFSTPLACL